jgi:ABC-type dipeptide/oligopeptide/nickel transport system permease subunit
MNAARWRALLRDPLAGTGLVLVLCICAIALLAPVLAPHDPIQQYDAGLTDQGLPVGPSRMFPLGTDDLGRDILSRLMYGARVSLEVGLFANVLAVGFGALLGISAGYLGGLVETAIMRFTDFMMAFPFLLFVMALVAVLQPSITNIFIAIASIGWITTARVLRAETLVLRHADYVLAARALGCSTRRIMLAHILPQLVGKITMLGSLGVAFTILLEAGLSYLGIGVPPPTPSWGTMLREGQDFYTVAPILIIAPGLCIVLTVVAFNLLAEGVDRALDPHRQVTHGFREETNDTQPNIRRPSDDRSGTAVPHSSIAGGYAPHGTPSGRSGAGSDPGRGVG